MKDKPELLSDLLERAERDFGDKVAVECGDERWTYRELADRVVQLASALASLGINAGDRIAILHRNCHRFLESYFAAAQLSGVLVPLNHRLTAGDLARILDDTDSRVLIVDDGWAELGWKTAEKTRTPLQLIWSAKEEPPSESGYLDYEEMVAGSESEPPAHICGEDNPAQIYYTSGTTGHQKGVVLTHRNTVSHALSTVDDLGLCSRDAWLHAAPMFHLADAWATWAMTWVGGRHVMAGKFEPRRVLETMSTQRVTVTNLVPTMLNDLVNAPDVATFDLGSLRLIMSGGAPISPHLVRRIVDTFRCEYVQTYGLTETSPYLTFSLLKDHLRELPDAEQMRFRSKTGRPASGISLRVVDAAGTEVPADEQSVGEILAKGDRITPGYWQNPEATAAAFTEGWFHTGDLATVDAEGYLNIVDRKKDVILTGGELVYSTEVENIIAEFPGLLEVAVVGVADERLGEVVCAVVVPIPGQSFESDELVEFCRERLAHFKCPRAVEVVDALPRTGSGKISKKMIRETIAKG